MSFQNSLASLPPVAAAQVVGGQPVLSMLDARKGRVYAAWYDRDGGRVHGPADVGPDVAMSWATEPFVATGEGALVYAESVIAAGGTVAPHADDPAVRSLARRGAAGLAAGQGIDPVAVEPLYLRAPDAKRPREAARPG